MAEKKKSSSDIYEVHESPRLKQASQAPSKRRHRRRESFDDAVTGDLLAANRRRSRNSGLRRFLHLLKKPDYSKKFWLTVLGIFVAVILVLFIWDLFFRYPDRELDYTGHVYRAVAE